MTFRRLVLIAVVVVVILAGFMAGFAGSARATPVIPPAPAVPGLPAPAPAPAVPAPVEEDCDGPSLNPLSDCFNPGGAASGAILDQVCPPREAPYPERPTAEVVNRGGGPGQYANYGYAGLRWTTYDSGCLSLDKVDTSVGSNLNRTANELDSMTNELQQFALSETTTSAFDETVARGIGGIRDALWTPWSVLGFAAAGLLILALAFSGRISGVVGLVGNVALIAVLVALLTARPTLPADVGNSLTAGVATGVSDSLMAVAPQGPLPAGATSQQKYGESFHQIAYQSWTEGSFCGDVPAAQAYGPRLRDAQAFTVTELARIEGNPAAATALVEAKQAEWLAVGEQMEASHPVAFGCWKGEASSRTGTAVKHLLNSSAASAFIVVGSVGLMAMKFVLRIAVLFFIGFAALALFVRDLSSRLFGFAAAGLVGPAFIAAGLGVLLWGVYAVASDPSTSWWISAWVILALGIGLVFGWRHISGMFQGATAVQGAGRRAQRWGRQGTSAVVSRAQDAGVAPTYAGTVAATAAGGAVVGTAAASAASRFVPSPVAVAASQVDTVQRDRGPDLYDDPGGGLPPTNPSTAVLPPLKDDPTSTPRSAPMPSTQPPPNAADTARQPVPVPVPAGGATVDAAGVTYPDGGQAVDAAHRDYEDRYATVKERTAAQLAEHTRRATEAGTPPTGVSAVDTARRDRE